VQITWAFANGKTRPINTLLSEVRVQSLTFVGSVLVGRVFLHAHSPILGAVLSNALSLLRFHFARSTHSHAHLPYNALPFPPLFYPGRRDCYDDAGNVDPAMLRKHLKRRRTAAFETLEEIRDLYSQGPLASRSGGRRSGASSGVIRRRRRSRKNVKCGMQTDEGFMPMVPHVRLRA
jgi:hypothetical protein